MERNDSNLQPERHTEANEADEWKPPVEIWVGSLADYNEGRLHGVWVDATQDPEELQEAASFMLRNSYSASAEEWAVMDYSGFYGLDLGEHPSLETVSLVAKGIDRHGAAYAAWVSYVGHESTDLLSKFDDYYLGEWESVEAYAEHVTSETGMHEAVSDALRDFPEDIRRYVQLDTAAMARDWSISLHRVEREGGGVWLFAP